MTSKEGTMNRGVVVIAAFAWAVGLLAASRVVAQEKTIEPDLAKLADGKGLNVFNRSVSSLNDGAKRGVRLSESSGEGVAYLQGMEFANGTIEFDVRGKDVQQQSFVGVAFHGVDGTTYDAIYFRPLDRKSTRLNSSHGYISYAVFCLKKKKTNQRSAS